MVDQRNFFALQATLFFFANVLKHHVGGRPIGAQQGEVPFEHRAINRLRQAVTHGLDRHFVVECLVGHGKGNAGGLRVKARSARASSLESLVAFDALGCVISGFTLLKFKLDAVHAAITRVHQLEVVGLAVGPRNAQGRELAGTVHQQRHKLLDRLGVGRADRRKAS